MNIALIGPPGAGKGTYAHNLKQEFNLKHLSTGDFLRLSFEDKSALGLLAHKYMQAGELVPDEVIDAIISECLLKLDPGQGILFDGFPRTVFQADYLEASFTNSGRVLDAIFNLHVSDTEIYRRLAGRLICSKCLLPYHMDFTSTRTCEQPGCDGRLIRRDDDIDGIPASRLAIYHRDSAPLVDYYHEKNALITVDTEKAIATVLVDLRQRLNDLNHKTSAHSAAIHKNKEHAKSARGTALPEQSQPADDGLNFIFLGAPGSGKGTQAKFLSKSKGIVQIATGDLFRQHISSRSELGNLAKFYIDRGELVPNNVTEQMVKSRLSMRDTAAGMILDGFPRTLTQASALGKMLSKLGRRVTAVFYFAVDDEAIIRRIAGRISCKKCQTPFHNIFNPFQACPSGTCNGEFLFQRQDDTPETVRKRLQTFYRQTEPLIDYYQQKGLLRRINANAGVEEVKVELLRQVENIPEKD